MNMTVNMTKREVKMVESWCDMIRHSETREQANKICEFVDQVCIELDYRGRKGMWIMSQINTAYEESFPWSEEDL